MLTKKLRRRVGDVIAIPLNDGMNGYGRVLREPLIAFYDFQCELHPPLEKIVSSPVAFVIFVMNHPITDGSWPVLGTAPLTAELGVEPLFFKKDPITGALAIYRDSTGDERPATRDECAQLECAAVWDPEHVVSRLRDHFAGIPNKWVDSMRV
ncbi:MAG: immunity 26/phosphotriesterase HocA family protein [Gemmataceae bacterium]